MALHCESQAVPWQFSTCQWLGKVLPKLPNPLEDAMLPQQYLVAGQKED